MKKALSLLLTALICCHAASARSIELSGEKAEKQFNVPEAYSELVVDGEIEVRFSARNSSAVLTADKAVIDCITVSVKDGKVKIGYKEDRLNISAPRKLQVITATTVILPFNKELNRITMEGKSIVKSDTPFSDRTFCLSMHGESVFRGTINADTFTVNADGSSTAIIQGASQILECNAGGACRLIADEYSTKSVKVDMGGEAHVSVFCNGSVKGKLNGAAILHYYGNAGTKDIETSGAAQIVNHN